MGKGIHFEESVEDMLKKHEELKAQISGFTKELTQFYQATIARTQDKRLFVYFKNALNKINEDLPKRVEKGLKDWWESDDGLHEFARRKGQGGETKRYLDGIKEKDLNLVGKWPVSTAILLKLNTGAPDINYSSEVSNIQQETQKYMSSIFDTLTDMQDEFDKKYDYAEEYYNISKSFKYIGDELASNDPDGFQRELLKDLDVLFEEKA